MDYSSNPCEAFQQSIENSPCGGRAFSHRLVRVVGAGWRSLPLTIDFRARTLSVDGGPAIESFVPAYLDKYQWYFIIVPVLSTAGDVCGRNVM